MNLLTRFSRWRRRRTIAKARYYLSLIISPDFAYSQSDDELADTLLRNERARVEETDEYPRSLAQIVNDFEDAWHYAANCDPEYAQRQIQALVDSIRS